MPDRVIVTIKWKGREADLELPSKTPLRVIEKQLNEAIRLLFPEAKPSETNWKMKYCGRMIDKNLELMNYGIFDGSIIEIE